MHYRLNYRPYYLTLANKFSLPLKLHFRLTVPEIDQHCLKLGRPETYIYTVSKQYDSAGWSALAGRVKVLNQLAAGLLDNNNVGFAIAINLVSA